MSPEPMVDSRTAGPTGVNPMVPRVFRVTQRLQETSDIATLALEPVDGPRLSFRAGQFNMLSAFGVGEVAISISGRPLGEGPLWHTIRDVGTVSSALCQSSPGDVVGVRGPFGTDWRVAEDDLESPVLAAKDVAVIAGGIGLAPLRGAVEVLVARAAERGRRVAILLGARDPDQVVFADDLRRWERQGAQVLVTVDRGNEQWRGRVGLVTTLLEDAGLDAPHSAALICGPEIMMRFSARALVDMGVPATSILVSLERNMQCGLGWCGHCQLGPLLLCRDGPVVDYAGVVCELFNERER